MKIRNGFVSNSSSASFILAFPKDKPVELRDIEDYFGGFYMVNGYNEELSPEYKDMFVFELWKSQYFDGDGDRRVSNRYLFRDDDGKVLPVEYTQYECTAPWEYIRENRGLYCDGRFSRTNDLEKEEKEYEDHISLVPPECKKCKYLHSEKRIQRDDDYYYVLDNYKLDDDLKAWLKEHEGDRIIELEIDDNEPPNGMSWDIASEIASSAYHIFRKYKDKAYVAYGK